MANLFGANVGTNYQGILNLPTLMVGLDANLQAITDGTGLDSAISISTTSMAVNNNQLRIGNDGPSGWEPAIYIDTPSNVNISVNTDTIVVSNNYSSGSYNPAKTPGAIFEMASTTQGMLLPRMRTTERNAIFTTADPVSGLVVYDTDLNKICYYNNSAPGWFALDAQPA
jgi:hypothetical protein